ncbi:473_t:CDS:2 [Diversispora eburnea]|uniref:473_t:CDS:1 n=1 Tax=Diversispora eburnea TaxID=1213867 RepID=A0A9N9AFP5_9GLOM|nr:473_t:CDS:2 [Diversispora eburnea]
MGMAAEECTVENNISRWLCNFFVSSGSVYPDPIVPIIASGGRGK